LEDGPPIFRQGFSCPALLFVSLVSHVSFHVQDYHLLWSAFPYRSVKSRAITNRLFRFRSPLLSESRLISFPRATEMFQFTRFASHTYVFSVGYLSVGFPIRTSWDIAPICRLPQAFRRLSRPSSPIIAKASTICSYSLDSITLTSQTTLCSAIQNLELFSRNVLFGLSPNALCRINLRLISYDLNP
jgi:hypothetical protein